jgi:predicted ATPase
MTRLAIIIFPFLLAASAGAQTIQKWKTPDGHLFFGDRPPPGSVKVGNVGKSSEAPKPVLSEEEFSTKATQTRYDIQRSLKQQSDRLWEIQRQLERVERLEPRDDPDFVVSQRTGADLAAFQNKKTETLRELEAAKRSTCSAIVDLWKRFDELNSEVTKRYDGKPPGWWRQTLDCPTCPSRDEAQSALG